MTKKIKGKNCGIYQRNGHKIWVASTGDYAAVCTKNNSVGKELPIVHDFNYNFVLLEDGTMLNIVNAVILNFGPSSPNDGKEYVINHKDGDWTNCDYQNLEWVPYHYRHSNRAKETLYSNGKFIEVHADGTIWEKGQKFSVRDHWVDHDMDLEYPSNNTFIWILLDERENIEDLMKECGYIQGDNAGLKDPVILHRDLDYHNCAANNLEWTEKTDPRYIKYCEKRYSDRKIRNQELNAGKHIPSDWV